MKIYQHQAKYLTLREDYHKFYFESIEIQRETDKVSATFHFHIDDRFHFRPQISLLFNKIGDEILLSDEELYDLFFHCGMVELISYWKSSCTPRVIVKTHHLDDQQIQWWKKLYFQGLGEFFYINGIETTPNDFMQIIPEGIAAGKIENHKPDSNRFIVPIGGGKDSPVTLELLKNAGYDVLPLIINPRGATVNTLIAAGLPEDYFIKIERKIDPQLLKMNNEGFLNGHTPFSAMLAFYTLISAIITNSKYIALSNESSANESTVKGSDVNHQYSKSFEFEQDFRQYYQKYIETETEYFSFLRPISELQIASLFAKMKAYHPIFRSCNVGSKEDKWCGYCPKCLFAAIIISPFLRPDEVQQIIGRDILNDENMRSYLDELSGKKEVKPFECVGTTDEVNLALSATKDVFIKQEKDLPQLLKDIKSVSAEAFQSALQEWNTQHNLPAKPEIILKDALGIK
ncbi:MAG: hypothetical protein C0592_12485 [Marinilabiliales bacterium]|nr:MAG: hypothetical protein C0592_12485 [Marinilabiliales bacterium]